MPAVVLANNPLPGTLASSEPCRVQIRTSAPHIASRGSPPVAWVQSRAAGGVVVGAAVVVGASVVVGAAVVVASGTVVVVVVVIAVVRGGVALRPAAPKAASAGDSTTNAAGAW